MNITSLLNPITHIHPILNKAEESQGEDLREMNETANLLCELWESAERQNHMNSEVNKNKRGRKPSQKSDKEFYPVTKSHVCDHTKFARNIDKINHFLIKHPKQDYVILAYLCETHKTSTFYKKTFTDHLKSSHENKDLKSFERRVIYNKKRWMLCDPKTPLTQKSEVVSDIQKYENDKLKKIK